MRDIHWIARGGLAHTERVKKHGKRDEPAHFANRGETARYHNGETAQRAITQSRVSIKY